MFEPTCRAGDECWRMSDEEIFQLAKQDCEVINFIHTIW